MALRFLKKGYSKQKTLAVMMGGALFFVMAGLVFGKAPNFFAISTLVLAGSGSLFLIEKMGRVQI